MLFFSSFLCRSMLKATIVGIVAIGASTVACEASPSSVSKLEQMQSQTAGRTLGAARLWNETGALENAPYTVKIDGQMLPILPAGHIVPAYYVRFQINQPLTLEIQVSLKDGETLNLQPLRYREGFEMNEGAFKLTINEPGPRVIMIESASGLRHSPLIIFPEKAGAWKVPDTAGSIFDASPLANKGLETPITSELQKMLDDCAAADQGGMVYLGPGTYYTGGLNIGDNTMVYLAPGAVLSAIPDPEVFRNRRHLLFFDGTKNSGLAGYGVVDGKGHIIRGTKTEVSVALVRFRKAQDAYVTNVTLRNAAAWSMHIIGCDRVKVDGVRILADWGVKNTDGIDPDNSADVSITNTFVYGSDDSFCVKTTNWYGVKRPTQRIEIRDSMVMSLCTPLKLGTESASDISDVLFENIDVVHSARGIGLWMRDGAQYSNVTFRNIRMDVTEYERDSSSGEPFRICIQNRLNGGGHIRNVLLENIQVTAPYRAIITGRDACVLNDITFRNIDWRIVPAKIKNMPRPLTAAWVVDKKNELALEGNPLLVIHRAEGVVFDDVRIDWSAVQDGPWDRFLDEQRSSKINVEGVKHQAYPF